MTRMLYGGFAGCFAVRGRHRSNPRPVDDDFTARVSVFTSVAHLAGALGKPAWVLLTYVPDFRWLFDRDDSPWYPTVRLFRQNDPRAWDSVMARVHEALLKLREYLSP